MLFNIVLFSSFISLFSTIPIFYSNSNTFSTFSICVSSHFSVIIIFFQYHTSHLSLEEIQNFDWNKEVYYFEENCKYSEIACEFYTETFPYMLSIDTNYHNVRIVF